MFENVNGWTDGHTDARTDGWTDDGRKVITITHPEQSSGELKRPFLNVPTSKKKSLLTRKRVRPSFSGVVVPRSPILSNLIAVHTQNTFSILLVCIFC